MLKLKIVTVAIQTNEITLHQLTPIVKLFAKLDYINLSKIELSYDIVCHIYQAYKRSWVFLGGKNKPIENKIIEINNKHTFTLSQTIDI